MTFGACRAALVAFFISVDTASRTVTVGAVGGEFRYGGTSQRNGAFGLGRPRLSLSHTPRAAVLQKLHRGFTARGYRSIKEEWTEESHDLRCATAAPIQLGRSAALASATICAVLGTLLVLAVRASRWKGRKAVEAMGLLPEMLPGIVLFWNQIYQVLPLYNTLGVMMLAYVVLFLPYTVQYVPSSFTQISGSLMAAVPPISSGVSPCPASCKQLWSGFPNCGSGWPCQCQNTAGVGAAAAGEGACSGRSPLRRRPFFAGTGPGGGGALLV